MSTFKKFLILDLILLLVIGVIAVLIRAGVIGGDRNGAPEPMEEELMTEEEPSEEETEEASPEDIDPNEWSLILVNPWNKIPDDYFDNPEYGVEIVSTDGGYEIDARVKEDLERMLSDCRGAGHSPVLISGFRTRATQQNLYDTTANKNDTAYPGTSEHECGLAVDILEEGYGGDWDNAEKTAQTETQKWLTENCQDYGFILRYPQDKEDITGIVYESWHYRYVGEEHARKIMESGQCLEEYLGRIDTDKEKIGSE